MGTGRVAPGNQPGACQARALCLWPTSSLGLSHHLMGPAIQGLPGVLVPMGVSTEVDARPNPRAPGVDLVWQEACLPPSRPPP